MIETTLTLSIATGILIAAAIIAVGFLSTDKITEWNNNRIYKKQQKEMERSPMVKRFQYLAGITNSYEDERGYLRQRFNRIRSTCYSTDYNSRFNLQNM